jgi:hypothetical protein
MNFNYVANVDAARQNAATQRSDFLGGLPGSLPIYIRYDYVGPFPSQTQRHPPADTLTGAGNYRRFSIESFLHTLCPN